MPILNSEFMEWFIDQLCWWQIMVISWGSLIYLAINYLNWSAL